MPPTQILLSAGEASGDMYAASLASELKKRADVAIFGMGGAQMRAAGVATTTDYSEVAVLGITEILKHLPQLRRAMRNLVGEALSSQARARDPYRFSRFSSAAGPETETVRRQERLLHLPAVLGMAPVAGESGAPPICARALHLSVRGKILCGRRSAGQVHRPPASRPGTRGDLTPGIRRQARTA